MRKDRIMHTYTQRMKLAKEMKIARIRSDLTQVQLAKILKTSQSFIHKYETGERRLEVIEFSIICQILNVKEQDMIELVRDSESLN